MNATFVSVEHNVYCVCDSECFVGCKRTAECTIIRIEPMCTTSHKRRKRKGRLMRYSLTCLDY